MSEHHVSAGPDHAKPNRQAPDGACFVHLNAWDDLRPWVNYRPQGVFVTDSLTLMAPAAAPRLALSLRLQRDARSRDAH